MQAYFGRAKAACSCSFFCFYSEWPLPSRVVQWRQTANTSQARQQTLAKPDTQQQHGMEGEPVRQTRRGVEPRPPEDRNRKTRQLYNNKTGGSQITMWREQITWEAWGIPSEFLETNRRCLEDVQWYDQHHDHDQNHGERT